MTFTTPLAHTSAVSSGGPVTTSGIDTTGANLIILWCTGFFTSGTPTDSKSNTWTPLTIQTQDNNVSSQFFYCYNPTVGTGHTFTGVSTSQDCIAVQAWAGAASSPFDQQNGSQGAGSGTSIQPGSITPTAANELIVAGVDAINSSTSPTVNSGMTITDSSAVSPGFAFGMAYLVQTSASAINPTWSYSSAGFDQTTNIASFKVASAPPPPSKSPKGIFPLIGLFTAGSLGWIIDRRNKLRDAIDAA